MIALQVTLNGRLATTAGVDNARVIGLVLNVVARPRHDPLFDIEIRVGGLDQAGQHVDWLKAAPAIGDEIVIRIVETNHADSPAPGGPLA